MTQNRWSRGAACAVSIVMLSSCAAERASGPLASDVSSVSAVILGPSSSYIIPKAPFGTFETFVANEVGRGAGQEFWDNASDDGGYTGSRGCSIGFFATDRMRDASSPCNYQAPGSDANAAGNAYTYMWSDGVKSAAFSFNGAYSYTVTLRGSYVGGNSRVGYYIKKAGGYTFTEVPEWTSRTIGFTKVINTGGAEWGFFIANGAGVTAGGCGTFDGLPAACSDATGGHVSDPLQQFALFATAGGTSYLVGAEDKQVLTSAGNDADYNDYLWSLVPDVQQVCDFMTFGRLVASVGGKKVVISGNAGGNAPGGGIQGEFHVEVAGVDYHVSDIASYGPISGGALFGLTNARVFRGTAKNGVPVEVRMYDGGEPGKGTDRVYVKLGSGDIA